MTKSPSSSSFRSDPSILALSELCSNPSRQAVPSVDVGLLQQLIDEALGLEASVEQARVALRAAETALAERRAILLRRARVALAYAEAFGEVTLQRGPDVVSSGAAVQNQSLESPRKRREARRTSGGQRGSESQTDTAPGDSDGSDAAQSIAAE